MEDGSPQTISAFTAGDFPLAVAIGLDRSFSMGAERAARLDTAKSAARAFIDALKPADQVMVIAVGSETDGRRAVVDESRGRAGRDRSAGRVGHHAAL